MISISYRFESNLLTSRGLKQILNFANRLALTEQKAVLDQHFENRPETRPGGVWGYAKRAKSYQIRKARKHGHQLPNVFSGDLRRAVLSSARVTATAKGGRLRARGSRGSNLREQRKAEIEAISSEEHKRHAENWKNTVLAMSTRPEYRKKTRKRNSSGQFI